MLDRQEVGRLPCDVRLTAKFNDLETTAGPTVCPTEGDEPAISAHITENANDIAVLLSGGTLPDCDGDLAVCSGDLATCDTDLLACHGNLTTCVGDLVACDASPAAQPLKTGQTTCGDAAGFTIACAGTGQDGDLQEGVARNFTDNGDGTITDNEAGLIWEKLSGDGTIHDKDDVYTWTDAFEIKLATLNATSFAGHTDWRLPNRFELETLLNLDQINPPTYPEFETNCSEPCSVITCSCTASSYYWSSTAGVNHSVAWIVYFIDGHVWHDDKSQPWYVRAVRSGS